MIPVPEANEPRSPPIEFLPFEPVRQPRTVPGLPGVLGARVGDLGLGALLRFKSLMAAEGHAVELARLCRDNAYAYERIAVAHAGGGVELRRLALELFQIYHRRSAGLPAQ